MDSARISGKFPCKACQELCLFCGQDRVKGKPRAKRQGQLWEVTELPGDLLSHRRPSVCVGGERGSERKGRGEGERGREGEKERERGGGWERGRGGERGGGTDSVEEKYVDRELIFQTLRLGLSIVVLSQKVNAGTCSILGSH